MIEPTRGSGAQISMLIEAIHNHRARPVQTIDSRRCHRLQRKRQRTGQVFLREDRSRQHVNERDALVEEMFGTGSIDPV